MSRQNAKRTAVGAPQRLKMTAVKRQYFVYPITVGQNDERGIGQPNAEVGVAFDNIPRPADIIGIKCFHSVGSASDFVEQRGFGLYPDSGCD